MKIRLNAEVMILFLSLMMKKYNTIYCGKNMK